MLFVDFRYLAEDGANCGIVKWVFADQLPLILDHGYPNVIFLAPVGLRIDIPILDFGPPPDQGQQLFQHDLAQVTALPGIIVNDGHLVRHR